MMMMRRRWMMRIEDELGGLLEWVDGKRRECHIRANQAGLPGQERAWRMLAVMVSRVQVAMEPVVKKETGHG